VFSTRNLAVLALIAVLLYLVLIGLQYAELRYYGAKPAAAAAP